MNSVDFVGKSLSTFHFLIIFMIIFHILSCNQWWILRQSLFLQGSTETLFTWNDMNEVTYLLVLAESSCFLKTQIYHARQLLKTNCQSCFQVSLVSTFNARKIYSNFVVVVFLLIIIFLFPAFGFSRPGSYNAQRCIALCGLGASRYPQRVRFLSAHGHSPGTYWPLGG